LTGKHRNRKPNLEERKELFLCKYYLADIVWMKLAGRKIPLSREVK
jgi:hypothetical protein